MSRPLRGAGPERLAAHLPYLLELEGDKLGPLILLDNDRIGSVLQLMPPVVDTVMDGEELASASLLNMLHALPQDHGWQWFCSNVPDVEAALDRYAAAAGEDPNSAAFQSALCERWRQAQYEGFFPDEPDINFFPQTRRIHLALQSAPLQSLPSPWRALGGQLRQGLRRHRHAIPTAQGQAAAQTQDTVPAPTQEIIEAFVAMRAQVFAAARLGGWAPRVLDGQELVGWVGNILFPVTAAGSEAAQGHRPATPVHAFEELREAIACQGEVLALEGHGLACQRHELERHHRVVSMLWPPKAVAAGILNELCGLRPRMQIVLAARSRGQTRALFELKARALLNARSTHRFNQTEMNERGDALAEVERRLFAEGERMLEMRLHLHIQEDDAEAAQESALTVCRYLQSRDIEACVEGDIGASLVLKACLPFGSDPRSERIFHRTRRLLSRDCADLHPGGGPWTGVEAEAPASGLAHAPAPVPSPVVLYATPGGEALFIDPSKAEKNPHALVIGQSGSGKSFFVHDYLLHLWRLPGVRLYLLSIKEDYRKIALLLGKYVDVRLDADLSLNPFTGPATLENEARWLAALVLMLTDGRPEERVSRDAEVTLQEALRSAWKAHALGTPGQFRLEHICLALEQVEGTLGRQLARHLEPYRSGPYHRLFNRERGVSAADRFVFFNLGNVLNQPCGALASFCIFSMIDEVMYDPRLRGTLKGLVADEVWALVRNPHAAAILERSLKAYRSLGAFALPIVQDPQDLDTPGGRVMLMNTATKIVLPMDPGGLACLDRYLRLNEREREIVANLRLVKRRYSEFFVSMDGLRSAKGLLIPDAMRYAVSTTDPRDEAQIFSLEAELGSMEAALTHFARHHAFGMGHP